MKRSDVRVWLHQAALDVAQIAEPRHAGGSGQRAPLTCAGHESLLEAEREARRLATSTGVGYAVVEVRDEDDPPGIEATFVVCPAEAVDHVSSGREVVLRVEFAALCAEGAERSIREALRLANRALRVIDQGHVQAMHDLLRNLQQALRDAHVLVTASNQGVSARPSGAFTTRIGGES